MLEPILKIVPTPLLVALKSSHEKSRLKKYPTATCITNNLLPSEAVSLDEIFTNKETSKLWEITERHIESYNLPDGTGGVNPGDRKAIFYLTNHFKPTSVLEVGTHIGASTIHIASALAQNNLIGPSLTTVDLLDVNDQLSKPWIKFGSKTSPLEMIKDQNLENIANFITKPSIEFLKSCKSKFDFIFLDGSHQAEMVYQEVPLALNLLNKNGVILLHDYYPMLKRLWSDGNIIPGPYLAVEKLKHEGANLKVLPLGKLPWPTKLNSNLTSLALLLKN